ncbi:hypothetical protein [Streptomyces sp. NPDC085932]|uniref:hypothetical protein n=1 Tax=Streptomyces sp. NPDC085932 TaxID=3365741 RepID=UPI0037CE5F5B
MAAAGAGQAKKAASTGGLVVSTRARFGFAAAPGRPMTPGSATSPRPCRRSSRAACSPRPGAGRATEQRLQQIAAESLAQTYFRINNTRAHGLGVEFTDVEHIEIEL